MLTITIFVLFVLFTLGLSWWLGRKATTASGYFAAHGQVGWFVNGVAFAGDYLSAASFLGICGMIAFYGYDGFLYSIGFLAGWVVALFVIAEPIKKLGKFTFADALSAKYGNSRGITLAAAISTLVISVLYLIPQMVGAGALISPLLKLETFHPFGMTITPGAAYAMGVALVGAIVITIVVTAGMVSTTWVQFIKGSLLVVFCLLMVMGILKKGITKNFDNSRAVFLPTTQPAAPNAPYFVASDEPFKGGYVSQLPGDQDKTGPLGPLSFLRAIDGSTMVKLKPAQPADPEILKRSPELAAVYASKYPTEVSSIPGSSLLLPGIHPTFKGIRSERFFDRLDFVSLMLALFCGTASLPHILIRYYTVKNPAAARKSTVVGIIAIGFFYMLTLYIGLGAMVSGNLAPDSNMAATKLAETFGDIPFAIISAIAFTTVLGTVSGLILAAAGAVAHDLIQSVGNRHLSDSAQVRVAKISSIVVGVIAVVVGIACKGFSAAFLVGWAFNVAASANLPALVMLLFWKRTTRQGIIASILVGLGTSVVWLLLTKEAMVNIYGDKLATVGIVPFSQPALITIPLAFITLVVVSLMTQNRPVPPAPPQPRGFPVGTNA